jgi:hypothetical protein
MVADKRAHSHPTSIEKTHRRGEKRKFVNMKGVECPFHRHRGQAWLSHLECNQLWELGLPAMAAVQAPAILKG